MRWWEAIFKAFASRASAVPQKGSHRLGAQEGGREGALLFFPEEGGRGCPSKRKGAGGPLTFREEVWRWLRREHGAVPRLYKASIPSLAAKPTV